ncbi:MAG: 2-oxoglutarate dehydrogenase E1 component [Phycisphaerae bacterium]|nr:2-oxoglutarate dehydrogenase E1 component [Phycisphaerae bacterium]
MNESGRPPDSLSVGFVEGLYEQFLRDPSAVPEDWRSHFAQLREAEPPSAPLLPASPFPRWTLFNPPGHGNGHAAAHPHASLQHRVDMLIRNYRVRGHIVAALDPLGRPGPAPPELEPGYYGLTEADMDRPFTTDHCDCNGGRTLRQIIECMRNTYCRSIGVQFMHIDDLAVRQWLQQRMESSENRLSLTRKQQLRILTWLTQAVVFEEFIQRKYVGAKSFSLEGAETLLPLLELAFEHAARQGVIGIVLGMAHRGRLNVLANVIGKSPKQIFQEFEDTAPREFVGGGDVKYHLGHNTDRPLPDGRRMRISLCFNPSHLESINPVAMGRVRAKQDRFAPEDPDHRHGLLLLIHGDAAFAGQGVVAETLNLSQLPGYTVGGALHVVVNNQIGFTTPPTQGRSSAYCTDVARMLQSPVFHVNGEDPEAVAQVVSLAMDFRYQFRRDVIIDMYCFRRRGHNEGDEPGFTQPQMYQAIDRREPVRKSYLRRLLDLGEVTADQADRTVDRATSRLEELLAEARRDKESRRTPPRYPIWSDYTGGPDRAVADAATGVSADRLGSLLDALTRLPDGFRPHKKIERLLQQRREMAAGRQPLDWAAAEALAMATLATEGWRIRMSGQDCERGTFSHRHAVLHDVSDGLTHMPLAHLSPGQAKVEIYNSPLSEFGVVGFEYGYSLDAPDALVLWEAQFGDFCNEAQVIIDQFIASAEDKWARLSGLTLLLPHGFEGQGPEHSSARLERFLLLAAEDNFQVAQPTTPAQFFHLLRRQVLRRWRKPLIVFTPKSLLRHPQVISPQADLAGGRFHRVLPDALTPAQSARVSRIVLCSGKVYYDLLQRRQEKGRDDAALVRIEQFYPFAEEELEAALAPYPAGIDAVWVQEEPENMGAWRFLGMKFGRSLLGRWPLSAVTRPISASPATGSKARHEMEQERLLAAALGE